MSTVKEIRQQDFSRGSNVVTNPFDLGKQQSILLSNLLLDEHGSLRVRDGTKIQTTSPDFRPIVKLFDFVKSDGTVIPLAILLGALVNSLYNRGTTPWTKIGDFETAYTIPDMLTFANDCLIAAGPGEKPWVYDGTTFSHVSDNNVPPHVPAGAAHESVHRGFYWLWNTGLSSDPVDGPSSLRSSDLNNPSSYPLTTQIFVDKDDGDSGTGIGQFTVAEVGISPTSVQILFKNFRGYEVTGVFGSSNFSIQSTKSDMGCVAGRTIKFCSGFGIIRLTHRGFALFDGVDDTLISEEIRPLLFGRSGYTGIDWAFAARSYAVSVQNPPLYVCACPTTGAALTRVFCYDLVRKAWSVLGFANAIGTLQLIANPGTLPVGLAGDYDQGRVRRLFSDDPDDDGAAISWQVAFRPVDAGSPQQPGYFRRVIAKIIGATAGQTIDWMAVFGPKIAASPTMMNGTVPVPVAVPLQGPVPDLGFGVSPFGGGVFGASTLNPEIDLTIDLGRIGNNALLTLSGLNQLRIRGLEWHVKPKAKTRATVFA